jgi:hypothetical protein
MQNGKEISTRESKDPMEKLARIAKKTDRFTLYILQILHTLLAGCNIVSLVILPIGDLGEPQGTVATSNVESSVRISGAVIPITAEESIQIPSQTQVYITQSNIVRSFLHSTAQVPNALVGCSIAWRR